MATPGTSTKSSIAVKSIAADLRRLMERLGGEDGFEWTRALQLFVRGRNPWPATDLSKNVAGSIELVGSSDTSASSSQALVRIDFVQATPFELGVREVVNLPRVILHAERHGLVPIPGHYSRWFGTELKKQGAEGLRFVVSRSARGDVELIRVEKTKHVNACSCRLKATTQLIFRIRATPEG